MRKPSSAWLLCSLSTAALLAHADGEVVRLTLDSNVVHRIAVAVDRVTTLTFPSDISGLEGAFISQQPTLTTRFALSFQSGGRYFSIRALGTNASANLNVILGRVIYALEFNQSGQPVYVVEFLKPTPPRPVTSLADPAPAPIHDSTPRPPVIGGAGSFGSTSPTNTVRSATNAAPPVAPSATAANRQTMQSPALLPPAAPPSQPRGRRIYQAPAPPPSAASPISTVPAPSVPKPTPEPYATPRSFYRPQTTTPESSTVRPAVMNTDNYSRTHYQTVSYRPADYTRSYPGYRSYTYSQPYRDDRWSYRRPTADVHLGISFSIGSCPSPTFRRVPFP